MDDVLRYYSAYREELRLASGPGALEFERTREILLRHLPAPPAVIVDAGGGPGWYSAWLAEAGYETHLIDVVPSHVEQARARSSRIASAAVGDARRLPQPAETVDALLLLGPLYHLTDRRERLAALGEARRVLKPGGLLAAAAISRYAPLTSGLHEGLIDDPGFVPVLLRDLETGEHRPAPDARHFTDAFFHLPEQLREEVSGAGFEVADLLGVEGPVWLARDFDARWQDPAQRNLLLDLARRTEREPALLGFSFHLLAIGRR